MGFLPMAEGSAPVSEQEGTAEPAAEPAAELTPWLDAIAEVTRAVNRAAPLDELLDLIAGATARLTGYDFCAVLVEDPDRDALLIRGSYGLSQEYVDAINAENPIPVRAGDDGEGPSSRAFRSQRPTTVLDVATDAPSRRWETVAAHQGYSSLVCVPLVAGQVPFGLLNCYTVDKHVFSAREIILLESMAHQAGLALETTRRLAASEERARWLAEEADRLRTELATARDGDARHQKLLQVVFRGVGPSAIAEFLCAVLACTVVVDDAAGRVLASAWRGGPPGPRAGRVLAAHERARARLGEGAAAAAAAVPPPPDRPGDPEGLVLPVLLDEELAGRLWALEPRRPLGPPDRLALARAAAVVALALLKERTAQEVEWRLSRDFFDDLFDPGGQSAQALQARARQLGADLTRPHTVLVIRRDTPPAGARPMAEEREAYAQRSLLSLVQRTSADWKGATLTATRSDHVVVLWQDGEHTRPAADFAEHLRREVHAYAGGWTASISIGPTCRDITEYGDAYRLAGGVLDLVQQGDRRDRVISLDTIGAYRLLLQVKRPRELEAFADSVLGTVRRYDEQHSTQLGATLGCYMQQRCNVGGTARTLHVHPNTVAYRLRRIEELLDVDLDDPQALLHLQLALMIEDVLAG